MRSRMLLLLALAIALTVGVAAARATSPTHATFHLEGDAVYSGACPFSFRQQFVLDTHGTVFSNGTTLTHSQEDATLTNLVSGRRVYLTASWEEKADPGMWTGHIVGVLVKARDESGKLLFVQSGQNAWSGEVVTKETPHMVGFTDWTCKILA